MNTNPLLAEALRGGSVESVHRGAFAVVDADGTLHSSLGDIERPIFPRSAVKVLQALPLVTCGAANAMGLTEEHLALTCASHGGEPAHVAAAVAMLNCAGVDPDVLECGAHWPYNEATQRAMAARGETPSALHNNCSGKHAGFVCLGCWMAEEKNHKLYTAGYVRPDHPVMREVSAAIQRVTGYDLTQAPVGTDGCSIPTHAIPLRHLAHGFARIGTGTGLDKDTAWAAGRLRHAVARHPFMVAGSGRFDTRVMERLGERVFCKVGAEGVYCAALPDAGLGVAIKMDDGNNARGCEVVMAELIQRLVKLDDAERSFMHSLSNVTLKNWNGIEVGQLRAAAF